MARRHAGAPLADDIWKQLSQPQEAWHFDFRSPPDCSDHKTLDLTFTADGKFNAVLFWYRLRLIEGVEICTSPQMRKQGDVLASVLLCTSHSSAWGGKRCFASFYNCICIMSFALLQ